MMVSLRQGPPPSDRPMKPATAAEVETLARRHGLQTIRMERHTDAFQRPGISWEILWLGRADDAADALPMAHNS